MDPNLEQIPKDVLQAMGVDDLILWKHQKLEKSVEKWGRKQWEEHWLPLHKTNPVIIEENFSDLNNSTEVEENGDKEHTELNLDEHAYDVTTGVVVDIGDRLNIVPVIDGYVVDSAICSIPYGATQVREALRSDLCANNKGLYSFQSPIEKLILRYVMEQVLKEISSSYVPEDYGKEEKSGVKDVMVTLEPFNPTPGMQTKFNIDSSRFTCTEGLFRPKKWGLDTKGLHQLVHEAVQMSPIDSRRTLYRNIYLAGGASLLPGLAEKLEQELANIVPNTIHTQVHISPWRYNAAYLGAQVVASSSTFEDKCVTAENLQKFLFNLSTSTF